MTQHVNIQDTATLTNLNYRQSLPDRWKGSATGQEYTFHQISPYIGKMKSSMARALINSFTGSYDTVYDPFCGSGTVALEAWAAKRHVFAVDLSQYAVTLTKAKLFPPRSLDVAMHEVELVAEQVRMVINDVDLRKIPRWVRSFFHPETLRETIAWTELLKSRESDFLLACLLGILHHQRPGFLSYPSSHTVPYLRKNNFPRAKYPELYEYREVRERLEKKVIRAMKRVPTPYPLARRECFLHDAISFRPNVKVNAIITSPPYMRQLDYGRDNRLRLWFLGESDWKTLDKSVSPSETDFLRLIKSCFSNWRNVLVPNGICILVLGDNYIRSLAMSLPEAVINMATSDVGNFSLISSHTEAIPNTRRVRRNHKGSQTETVLALRKNNAS